MKPITHFLFITLVCVLVSSCQKPFLDPDGGGGIDPDAQNFISAAGITDIVQKTAINDFVIQLKDSLIWDKFMAIYPMIGGTQQSIKWNLKDPRDQDAAFRLTIYGTPTYSSTGVLFPTNSDYADTHFIDSMFIYNDNSISYYSLTQNTVDGYDMGCMDNAAPYNEFSIYFSNDASVWFGYRGFAVTPLSTRGLFMFSSTWADVKRYENGVHTDSRGSAPLAGFTNKPILLGIVAQAISGGHRECALATIGRGLSDREALAFYIIAQAYETRLGR